MYASSGINHKNVSNGSVINDRLLNFFLYPAISFLVIHIGNENSLIELLQINSYYTDILLALTCTYGIGWYLKRIYRNTDKRFEWYKDLKTIITRNAFYGMLLPLLVAMTAELIYIVFILNLPVSETAIFYLELPLAALFLLLLNILYIFLYTRKHLHMLKTANAGLTATTEKYKEQVLVFRGAEAFNIVVSEIAFFIILNKTTFLITKCNQKYLYNEPLQTIAENINPNDFFILNRQVLAAKNAVKSFEQTDTRKLIVSLEPNLTEEVFVSKARAAAFIKWMGA
jgi:DNA-binding LytR/AlgR family response regulator